MAAMEGEARRRAILRWLGESGSPVPGGELAERSGVSRQAVARDVAVLRAAGHDIVATSRGYVLGAAGGRGRTRVFKVRHTRERLAEELRTIVDLGATVEDVIVNHRVYGVVRGRLGIASRRDVDRFMRSIESGRSAPLMEVTSGYHFHTVSAPDEETLDAVGHALDEAGFTAPILPYERDALAGE
jgi:transcriptional regulator of NAD metabolism